MAPRILSPVFAAKAAKAIRAPLAGLKRPLSAVGLVSHGNLAAFAIDEAKCGRFRRPLDFLRRAHRGVRIGGDSLDFVKRAGRPEETNAVNLRLPRHSRCPIPWRRAHLPRWRAQYGRRGFIGVAPSSRQQ